MRTALTWIWWTTVAVFVLGTIAIIVATYAIHRAITRPQRKPALPRRAAQ